MMLNMDSSVNQSAVDWLQWERLVSMVDGIDCLRERERQSWLCLSLKYIFKLQHAVVQQDGGVVTLQFAAV